MLAAAREMPPWRSRQLAAWLSDHRGLSVSASTVYRILRREGLVKRIEYQLAAGKEYQHKTTGPPPAVGHRCLLLPCSGLGLLLPRDGDGRLLPVHLGLEGATGHDGQLPHRGGPGSC